MKFGSVCSGIDAASVAWTSQFGGPMNWAPVFFSEIEDWPCAALAHHYGANLPDELYSKNGVPNYGDMTQFKMWPDHSQESDDPVDVLIGGTPCQSFSIAGLRKGLDDPRGNLALTFIALIDRYRPRFFVWENVPGVFSSWSDETEGKNGERWQSNDFDTFIAGLTQIGYHCAWRVLDAQYVRVDGMERAVPQRRRRVFVVGHFRDWRCAAAVLFDRDSVQGNPAPRRETRQSPAPDARAGFTAGSFGKYVEGCGPLRSNGGDNGGDNGGGSETIVAAVASTLNAAFGDKLGLEDQHINSGAPLFVQEHPVAFKSSHYTRDKDGAPDKVTPPLSADADKGDQDTLICAPVAFAQNTRDEVRLVGGDGGVVGALAAEAGMKQTSYVAEPITIMERGRAGGSNLEHRQDGTANAILTPNGGRGGMGVGAIAFNSRQDPEVTSDRSGPLDSTSPQAQAIVQNYAVRRLTPTECERLQAFPDGYTNIPWRGKPTSPDGRRYKALGNSMAVNVIRWIGQRIEAVDKLYDEAKT